MTAPTFTARQMRPGHDTIDTMALHYDLTPTMVREVIREAEAPVIRADGFEGTLELVRSGTVGRPRLGWADGEVGIDTSTTKLTREAIMTVARWRHQQDF